MADVERLERHVVRFGGSGDDVVDEVDAGVRSPIPPEMLTSPPRDRIGHGTRRVQSNSPVTLARSPLRIPPSISTRATTLASRWAIGTGKQKLGRAFVTAQMGDQHRCIEEHGLRSALRGPLGGGSTTHCGLPLGPGGRLGQDARSRQDPCARLGLGVTRFQCGVEDLADHVDLRGAAASRQTG